MKENIRYTLAVEKSRDYFFFDHVHIRWDNQINLHQQDSWELSYVITGRGVRVIGDTVEPFSQGEVILIPPNIPHCWSFDEEICDNTGKIENITISFTNQMLADVSGIFEALSDVIYKISNYANAISFSNSILSSLQKTMTDMVKETAAERISSLVRLLCLIATPENASIVGRPVVEDKNMKRKQALYLYVMNNYQHNITLDDVARFVGMEKSAFCVFFKKMSGKSFFTFLTNYRVEASCQMLLKTSKTVAEVCIASGFRDVPYYNRMFKKIMNITPTEYRKKMADT